jgi:selenoprotein W-related protein
LALGPDGLLGIYRARPLVSEIKSRVLIAYCRQCNRLLRAAWMAQELLATFPEDIRELALVPGTGGIFRIEIDGALIWERKRDGGFPEIAQLKRLARDHLAPERKLGHLDRPTEEG